MGLNWNEIKSRAFLFSKTWADACNENSQAKPFWIPASMDREAAALHT